MQRSPGSRQGPACLACRPPSQLEVGGWPGVTREMHLTPALFNAETPRVGGSVSPLGWGAGRSWLAGFDFGTAISAEVTRRFPERPEKEALTPPVLGLHHLCRNRGGKGPDWLLGTSDPGFCKVPGTLAVDKVYFAELCRIGQDPLKLYYVHLFFTFTQEKVKFDRKEKLKCLRSFREPASSVQGRAVGGGHHAVRHRCQQPPRPHIPPNAQW